MSEHKSPDELAMALQTTIQFAHPQTNVLGIYAQFIRDAEQAAYERCALVCANFGEMDTDMCAKLIRELAKESK